MSSPPKLTVSRPGREFTQLAQELDVTIDHLVAVRGLAATDVFGRSQHIVLAAALRRVQKAFLACRVQVAPLHRGRGMRPQPSVRLGMEDAAALAMLSAADLDGLMLDALASQAAGFILKHN